MTIPNTSGRWTLTMTTPNTGVRVNIRFASEASARAYREELMAQNERSEDDELMEPGDEGARPMYLLWFDPAANPDVNIPCLPHPSRGLRSAIDSTEAYDPNDF